MLIFEHGSLYNMSGALADRAGGGRHCTVRRSGGRAPTSRSMTYGGTLPLTLDAAQLLAADGIDAEVDRPARPAAPGYGDGPGVGAQTHRAVVIDEGWRSGSLSAEVSARLMEEAFYDLDAPVGRVCSAEVPMPYARHLGAGCAAAAPAGRRGGGAGAGR